MIHKQEVMPFKQIEHQVDLCIVGGGMAGILAAVSAARHGTKVALMHDRPVLGGNASSEIRMWIRGAHGENNKETGILEEIELESMYRNPNLNYAIWDSILYEKVKMEENITLILNCSCCEAKMDGNEIIQIKGWQTTTQTWHTVNAKLFADCSGDSVLAPLTGAEFRMGRESSTEFGEDIAPEESDKCTMGMSCLFQTRETTDPIKFIAPKWANKYTKEDFPYRIDCNNPHGWKSDNYWWMELGGVYHSIEDTEMLRDELLKVAFGVWDFIKNSGYFDSENWDLEWLGFLPGKRESRRYVGDHILTQHDVRAGGQFEDVIAYGGWSMDDHHPEGIKTHEKPTIFHPAPSPYGIPYRCLYSKNISNLMFAGRNISTTHSALSSCRVMATCAILGQALGTAASIAIKEGISPRGVYEEKIDLLKQTLIADDCYLPNNKRVVPNTMHDTRIFATSGDPSVLTDGIERQVGKVDHAWVGDKGSEITFEFTQAKPLNTLRIVCDSDLTRKSFEGHHWYLRSFCMRCNTYLNDKPIYIPYTIMKAFEVWGDEGDGAWKCIFKENDNYQRLIKVSLDGCYKKIKVVPVETWGSDAVRIYSMDID